MKDLDRNRLDVGNYRSALKNFKAKDTFWDRVREFLLLFIR